MTTSEQEEVNGGRRFAPRGRLRLAERRRDSAEGTHAVHAGANLS